VVIHSSLRGTHGVEIDDRTVTTHREELSFHGRYGPDDREISDLLQDRCITSLRACSLITKPFDTKKIEKRKICISNL